MTLELGSPIRGLAVASHLLLVAVLAVAILQWWKIPAQLSSGYVPDDYGLFITAVGIPVILAGFILATVVPWIRGRRRLLIATDLAVTFAAWPVLIFIVAAADLPFGVLLVAPLALVLAVVAPRDAPLSA